MKSIKTLFFSTVLFSLPIGGTLVSSCPFLSILKTVFETGTGNAFCQEVPKEGYFTKTYVDTLILRAFYELNAADAYGDFQNRRKKSIAEAKRIARNLRHAAKNDPNERYILWKVGELEGQIALEEQDILQENERNRQKVINHLVAAFNRATGKKRPDFATLWNIHSQMQAVDKAKASEIDWLIKDRASGISRDVQRSIVAALNKRHFHRAQTELDYCSRNLKHLDISLTTYSKLAARLKARIDIDDEKSFVASDLKSADELLSKNELSDAADVLRVVHRRLSAIQGKVPRSKWEFYANKADRMSRAIEKKEDSLVTHNIDILNVHGIEAAMDYLDKTLLKKYGISREKAGIVNNTIIQRVIAEQSQEDPELRGELAELTSEEPSEIDVGFGDMTVQAKQIAQERQDSIAAEREKRNRKSWWQRIRERRARRRKERREARRLAKLEKEKQRQAGKQREKAASGAMDQARLAHSEQTSAQTHRHNKNAPADTRSSSKGQWNNQAYQDSVFSNYKREEMRLKQQKEEQAKERLVEIYTLIEQDRVRDAYERFLSSRDELKKHVYEEAYAVLQATVNQAYRALQQTQ
ncbi:MAG: hypothetical protein GF350_10745 [Chitinivibrionales bacterium]|nr:hypothetical protein [Chitinivibrionales bacterium]